MDGRANWPNNLTPKGNSSYADVQSWLVFISTTEEMYEKCLESTCSHVRLKPPLFLNRIMFTLLKWPQNKEWNRQTLLRHFPSVKIHWFWWLLKFSKKICWLWITRSKGICNIYCRLKWTNIRIIRTRSLSSQGPVSISTTDCPTGRRILLPCYLCQFVVLTETGPWEGGGLPGARLCPNGSISNVCLKTVIESVSFIWQDF